MIQWVQSSYEPKIADKILQDWFRGQELMSKREAFDELRKFASKEAISEMAENGLIYTRGKNGGLQTEDALHYIQFMQLGSVYTGSKSEFAEGFNFEAVAAAALEFIETNATHEYNDRALPGWPTNYFQEWVKQDRDAAFTFYEENKKDNSLPLPFSDYVDLVEGYVANAPKEESAEWVNSILAGGELSDNEYKDIVKIIAEQKLGGVGYSQTIFDTAEDADYLKAEIVAESFSWGGDDRYENAMMQFDSFEDYLVVAERAIANGSPFYRRDYDIVKKMEKLERPQSEIDRIKSLFKEAEEQRREARRSEAVRKARG